MEGHELHPSQDWKGTHWFDPDEVERVIAEREMAGASGSRGWLEVQHRARTGISTQRSTPAADERALLAVIGERLSLALVSLTARELSEIPEGLLDAVTDVLDAVGH